jgi:hypothetical protein
MPANCRRSNLTHEKNTRTPIDGACTLKTSCALLEADWTLQRTGVFVIFDRLRGFVVKDTWLPFPTRPIYALLNPNFSIRYRT